MKKPFLTLAAMLVASALHAETITPVQKQPIPEAAGKNVLMATVAYKPGEASEAHRHPGSIFAYVLEGHVTSQLEGSPAKTYGPGESWYEPPGAHHVVSKNASSTKPAKLLVFALAGEGEALKLPLQEK
jgi:quercetin dioxygenase-like cupin family protein